MVTCSSQSHEDAMTFIMFDIEKAYPRVNRTAAWRDLHTLGLPRAVDSSAQGIPRGCQFVRRPSDKHHPETCSLRPQSPNLVQHLPHRRARLPGTEPGWSFKVVVKTLSGKSNPDRVVLGNQRKLPISCVAKSKQQLPPEYWNSN